MATTQVDLGNVRGPAGAAGARGSLWYSGTAITGTAATGAAFASSGISDARVGDMYLNITTGNVYRCTAAGNAANAKWAYSAALKGPKGNDLTVSGVKAGLGLKETTANGVKTISINLPVGIELQSYAEINPAALFGGTWTVRTDTHGFRAIRYYRKTA